MNLSNIFRCKQKRKVFTRNDCTESDLIQYSVDHFKAAQKLYEVSDPSDWRYLHSAASLSALSIEQLLKACILHSIDEFPVTHDLKRLFKQLRKRGIKLSRQNKKWLDYLNSFHSLRYPDPKKRTTVHLNQGAKTKSLFMELWNNAPKEIIVLLGTFYRWSAYEKSGKPILPEN